MLREQLATQLSWKAQHAYAVMSNEDSRVYEKVKETILTPYDMREETYLQRFRELRKAGGQTFRWLLLQISYLSARKWLEPEKGW